MNTEPTLRPYGETEAEPQGTSPHLTDYWQVISRRLWLVLVIFTVTTASSIWAISRERTYYQGNLSLQVNDPLERQRGLVRSSGVSGMDFLVDPIESEIQVLRSTTIAATVADSAGLRLRRVPANALRSELAKDVFVDARAPLGRYHLVYDPTGTQAELRSPEGLLLSSGAVGTRLDAGFVDFIVQPPFEEQRRYDLDIVPVEAVLGEIAFGAAPRESTNIIDVSLVHPDPYVVPLILNAAGRALREKGAERVRVSAREDIRFINERLDDAAQKRAESQQAIQDFKRTQAFSNLSAREQTLVTNSERLSDDFARWNDQRVLLSNLVESVRSNGVADVDLSGALAQLAPGEATEVRSVIQSIQTKKAEERRYLVEERKGPQHPQVVGVRAEIMTLGNQLIAALQGNLQLVQNRLSEITQEQAELRSEQARFPDLQGELATLESQLGTDRQAYNYLQGQLYEAEITAAAASPYVSILDPSTGAYRIDSRGRVNVLLGALLGLILGVGAAFFLEYLDRTVRTSSDVESLLGIPVLGIIPRLRRLEEAIEGSNMPSAPRGIPMVVAMDPLDPAAEAYRNLRMNLMFLSSDEEPVRTILFSSPGPSEGKSTTAVNFSVMLARQGQRVLLIDADLRRPSLHRALDVLREPGLTNLLIGDAEVRETVRPNVLPNLDFLPSGPFPPNPSELLNSKTMVRILEEFEGRYDHVIIDSPPVLAVTDAAILAVHTDGAVIVLRSGETEQRTAERSVDQLRRLGVRVFGAVLNEVSATNPDESYYLQYYYSYHPQETGGWQRLRENLGRVKFFA